MIVTCPACQTRYRFRGGDGETPERARCSRCDEVFALSPSAARYRVVAAVRRETEAAPVAAMTAGVVEGAAMAGPAGPMPTAQPALREPVVPETGNLDLDLPAAAGPSAAFDPSAVSIPAPGSPAPAARAETQERAEPTAPPRRERRSEPRATPSRGSSLLRSLFHVAFALVWIGLGAAGGYFGYRGEEPERLIAGAAGGLGGLLAAALLLRWISGRR